ncbi:MAG: lytic transglycosylase domain-containing protein [Elusimicrobia bacterium]|nr:lytic transglycosylase domain-containing protein [Elusimicrobiota bacterium]
MSAAPTVTVPTDIWLLCKTAGPRHGISAALLAALCWKESGFYQYAFNPEPRWRFFVDATTGHPFRKITETEMTSETPPPDFPALYGDRDQEWVLQQASIGIAQVMGAVARELGFQGRSLLELTKADVCLNLGAKHLAKQIARFGSTADGLSAYNAGSPTPKNVASYVDPIMRVADAQRGKEGV